MLPVIKRFDKEVLAPAIERVWGIMMRGNLLPKPIPPEIVGHLIGIKYISPFAMAMLAAETTAIERLWAFAGNSRQSDPGFLITSMKTRASTSTPMHSEPIHVHCVLMKIEMR
jgi:hypothetical protein